MNRVHLALQSRRIRSAPVQRQINTVGLSRTTGARYGDCKRRLSVAGGGAGAMKADTGVFRPSEPASPVVGDGGDGMSHADCRDIGARIHGVCARHVASLRNRVLQLLRLMAVALSH
jgi:hypothetical protein